MSTGDKAPASLQVEVARGVFRVVSRVVTGLTDRWVTITVVCVSAFVYCFQLWLLPPEKREPLRIVELVGAFADIVTSGVFCVLGWALFAVTAASSWITMKHQSRRLRSQGSALRLSRKKEHPHRLSTHADLDIEQYEQDARRTHGDSDDS